MLVGLTGLKGSGKDTVADYLVEHHNFHKLGFADLLKESVSELFDISIDVIEQHKNNKDALITFEAGDTVVHMNLRRFLQRYGTEAHRHVFGDNFWVDAWVDVWINNYASNENIVIPDVRFDNEAEALFKRNAFIYQVARGLSPDDPHPSELGIFAGYLTGVISNTGTFEELYNKVELELGL